MKRFHQQATTLIKQAVFQDKPFLVLVANQTDITCAYEGSENELVESLTAAIENDPDLYRILKRSIQQKDNRDLEPTVLTLRTA